MHYGRISHVAELLTSFDQIRLACDVAEILHVHYFAFGNVGAVETLTL